MRKPKRKQKVQRNQKDTGKNPEETEGYQKARRKKTRKKSEKN